MAAGRLAVVLALICSPTVVMAADFKCRSTRGMSPYQFGTSEHHDHMRYAPAEVEIFKDFGAFVSSFDGDDDDNGDGRADLLAVPQWVAYELKGVKPDADGEYKEPPISLHGISRWYKDPDLSFLSGQLRSNRVRAIHDSYSGIGSIWNRGHLAMADHIQRYGFADAETAPLDSDDLARRMHESWQASCATHVFFNAVPQAASMNQGPWLHLETYVAALANKYGSVWTIAGPVFRYEQDILYIGDPGEVPVAVPHALFKILVIEAEGEPQTRAFIFEQPSQFDVRSSKVLPAPDALSGWVKCSSARRRGHVFDHRERLTSISNIQDQTGLSFEGYGDSAAMLLAETEDLWFVEEEYWTGYACGGQRYNSASES